MHKAQYLSAHRHFWAPSTCVAAMQPLVKRSTLMSTCLGRVVQDPHQSANVDLQTPCNFLSNAVAAVSLTCAWPWLNGAFLMCMASLMLHASCCMRLKTYAYPTIAMQYAEQAASGRLLHANTGSG